MPSQGLSYPTDTLVSAQIDLTSPLPSITPSIPGKTILITGGASGIGEACASRLALLGAHVAIGDLNQERGKLAEANIAKQLKDKHGKGSIKFFECDVSSYASQSQMFLDVVQWSPAGQGVLNCVIVNAGVKEVGVLLEPDDGINNDRSGATPPPPPDLTTFNTNFLGSLYTIRLAHHFLRHNPSPSGDRHILLMGSYSAFLHSPVVPLYSTAKHGLLGLFCSLRLTSLPHHKTRINMLAPYFVMTSIMPQIVKTLLVGQPLLELELVVDNVIRMVGDERIAGRMLALGPQGWSEDVEVGGGLEEVETFSRRAVRALNMQYRGTVFLDKWGRIIRDVCLLLFAWICFTVLPVLKRALKRE